MTEPKLNLIVLPCKDIEATKVYYEKVGLRFVKEKHGTGPDHYSTTLNGLVIELYPENPNSPAVKLGFVDAKEVVSMFDPDGRRIFFNRT